MGMSFAGPWVRGTDSCRAQQEDEVRIDCAKFRSVDNEARLTRCLDFSLQYLPYFGPVQMAVRKYQTIVLRLKPTDPSQLCLKIFCSLAVWRLLVRTRTLSADTGFGNLARLGCRLKLIAVEVSHITAELVAELPITGRAIPN